MIMRGVTDVAPKKWPFNGNFLCLHFLWKAVPSIQLKCNVYVSALLQLLGLQGDVTVCFPSLFIKWVTSWAVFWSLPCQKAADPCNVFQSVWALPSGPGRRGFPGTPMSIAGACDGWGAGSLSRRVTALALLLTFPALSMYHGYGFVQYDHLEDVQAALAGENGRLYKGYRLGKDHCSALSWPSMRSVEGALVWSSGQSAVWDLPAITLNHLTGYGFAFRVICCQCCVVHLQCFLLLSRSWSEVILMC